MQVAAKKPTVESPQSLAELGKLIIRQFPKSILMSLPIAAVSVVIAFVINTVQTVVVSDGYNSWPAYLLQRSFFWTLFAVVVTSFVSNLIRQGPTKVWRGFTNMPKLVQVSLRAAGSTSTMIMIVGALIATLVSTIVGGVLNSLLLAFSMVGALASGGRSLLFAVIPLTYSDIQRLTNKQSPRKMMKPSWMVLGILGAAIGFALSVLYNLIPRYNRCAGGLIFVGLAILGGVIIYMRKSSNQVTAATPIVMPPPVNRSVPPSQTSARPPQPLPFLKPPPPPEKMQTPLAAEQVKPDQMETGRYCPKCRGRVQPHMMFCPHCGISLAEHSD